MAVPAYRSLNLGVLRIPDMLRDTDNARQPSSSVVVTNRLVQLAVQDDYAESCAQLRLANPEACAALVTYGEGLPTHFDVDDAEDLDLTQSQRRRRPSQPSSCFLSCSAPHVEHAHHLILHPVPERAGAALWSGRRVLGHSSPSGPCA